MILKEKKDGLFIVKNSVKNDRKLVLKRHNISKIN